MVSRCSITFMFCIAGSLNRANLMLFVLMPLKKNSLGRYHRRRGCFTMTNAPVGLPFEY